MISVAIDGMDKGRRWRGSALSLMIRGYNLGDLSNGSGHPSRQAWPPSLNSSSISPNDTTCWPCGAPADPASAYVFRLFAASGRHLDARGCDVTRSDFEDRVRVIVPRCRACRTRGRRGIATVFGGAAVGGVTGAVLPSVLWSGRDIPAWLLTRGSGALTTATGIGMLTGFLVGLVWVGMQHRKSGLRRLDKYPAVRMLMREGWHYSTAAPP